MIKFLDLKKINATLEDEFKQAFNGFLASGHYILGQQVAKFETDFANYCGTKYCIGVSNGLDAIKLVFEGYKAIGVLKEGDEVLVPANTYIASVLAISHTGLTPVLVMPNLSTFNICTKQLIKAITPKTKAILGVHLYGQLYDVDALESIAKEHGLLLIEDAAQAHGAVYNDGRKAGNLSEAAAFSFYPTKNLGALGDAGAITTNNQKLANVLFKLRDYGRSASHLNELKGYNNRMDELQAAFLGVKLKYLDADNLKRRAAAITYLNGIKQACITLPKVPNTLAHVFHLFVVKTKKRKALQKYLSDHGIETLIHYQTPITKQQAYREFGDLNLKPLEQLHDEILSLPLNPSLSLTEIDRIIEVINAY